MKKILSMLLALLLATALAIPALAEPEPAPAASGFNADVTITTDSSTQFTVNVPTDNNSILTQYKPTLRIPCPANWTSATVTFDGEKLDAEFADHAVSFQVSQGGVYTVQGTVPAPVWIGGDDKDQEPEFPFTDVSEKAWYRQAVEYVFEKGYFAGVSATAFAPNSTMDRGMFARVVYNLAGAPSVTGAIPFTDVEPGVYYTDPVIWASGKKLIAGYGDGRFGPKDPVTRQQMAFILWNYAGKPAAHGDFSGFTDEDRIANYARPAMEWMVSKGILAGKGDGILDPAGFATRAEVAQLVKAFDNL